MNERVSDGIYERSDHQSQLTPTSENNDDYQELEEQKSDKNGSPYQQERQLPLFIITEEENSEIHSSNHTLNRMGSINSSSHIDRQGATIQDEGFMRINSDQYINNASRDQNANYQKSKSQPIRQRNSAHNVSNNNNVNQIRFSQNTQESDTNIVKTDTSPYTKRKNNLSPNFNEFRLQGNGFNQQRVSNESPFQGDPELISQYFKRMQSVQGVKSNINNTQADFNMSDEDLLSNIDRVSKILPTHEMSEEDEKIFSHRDDSHFLQRLKEQMQINEHLKCENQNKQTLLTIKESQMNLLQLKNEQLEDRIADLLIEMQSLNEEQKSNMVDAQVQCNEEEAPRIKIKPKRSKQSTSAIKKTPSRVSSDFQQEIVNNTAGSGNISKNYSTSNVFDTPQIRLDKIMRESPSPTAKMNIGSISKQHSMSFQSDDINHFKQQIAVMRQQIQRSEENNLDMSERIEKLKLDKRSQKEKVFQLSVEKSELVRQIDILQKEQQSYQRKFEGLKLEIQDYIRQIEVLEIQLEKQNVPQMEREVSAKSLALLIDEGVQTEFIYSPQAKINKTLENNKKQLNNKSLQIIDDPHNESSCTSTKSLPQQNHITIINNKQDMRQLLDKAKDYEAISQHLQYEIKEHRRALREQQEKAFREVQEQKDQKRRIKKRDFKIQKLRQEMAKLEKDKIEMSVKLEECQTKLNNMRLKMESKLQEKEFKLISLKNQMKVMQMPNSSGFMTPMTPLLNTSILGNGAQKVYSQNELYAFINQVIQQQLNPSGISGMSSKKLSQENLLQKHRAKSYDQVPFKNPNIVSFQGIQNSPNFINEPRISNDPHLYFGQGENPSFSQNDNNTYYHERGNSYASPQSRFPVNYQHLSSFNDSAEGNSDEIQHIFNSSMKRISQELQSIKQINQDASRIINRTKPQRQNYIKIEQTQIQQPSEPNMVYEDSLQTQINEKDDQEMHNVEMNRLALEKLQDRNRGYTDSLETKTDNNNLLTDVRIQPRKMMSMKNTQTFRKALSNTQNTPSNARHNQYLPLANIEFSEIPKFNNTGTIQEKEQNASFFLDFKPAFENSNIINQTNSLDQTQTQQYQGLRDNQIPQLKFDTQLGSLNNSFKQPSPIMASNYHYKLTSNLMTREADPSLSPKQNEMLNAQRNTQDSKDVEEFKDSFSHELDMKYKSLNQIHLRSHRTDPNQHQLASNIRYDMTRGQSSILASFGPKQRQTASSNQRVITPPQYLSNLNHQIAKEKIDGTQSTLSNYSQKLDDLKKKYGRLN